MQLPLTLQGINMQLQALACLGWALALLSGHVYADDNGAKSNLINSANNTASGGNTRVAKCNTKFLMLASIMSIVSGIR
jgi:hypothetical protein